MRRAVAIILAAGIAAGVTGCGVPGEPFPVGRNSYDRFRVVETYGDGAVLVDKDSGIGYYRYTYGGSFAMFPIYDEDGRLYRPNGWRDYGG